MAEQEEKVQEQQPAAADAPQAGIQTPMKGKAGAQAPLNNQMGQPRPCPKDCRMCSMQQQICCSSILSFQAFEVMNGMIQRLDIQSQRIADLEAKIGAIQSAEGELSSPIPFQGDLFAGQQ